MVALVADLKRFGQEYRSKARDVFQQYYPYELSVSLSEKEKHDKMSEW